MCCENGSASPYLSYMVSQTVYPVLYNLANPEEKMRFCKLAPYPAQIEEKLVTMFGDLQNF